MSLPRTSLRTAGVAVRATALVTLVLGIGYTALITKVRENDDYPSYLVPVLVKKSRTDVGIAKCFDTSHFSLAGVKDNGLYSFIFQCF